MQRNLTIPKLLLSLLNSLALLSIITLFALSFFHPASGPVFIILAAAALVVIGMIFVIVFAIERKNERYKLSLSSVHRFLSITLRILVLIISIITLLASLVFFFISMDYYFLVNTGCVTAFIMVILLIEVFLRILLPLAGFT